MEYGCTETPYVGGKFTRGTFEVMLIGGVHNAVMVMDEHVGCKFTQVHF